MQQRAADQQFAVIKPILRSAGMLKTLLYTAGQPFVYINKLWSTPGSIVCKSKNSKHKNKVTVRRIIMCDQNPLLWLNFSCDYPILTFYIILCIIIYWYCTAITSWMQCLCACMGVCVCAHGQRARRCGCTWRWIAGISGLQNAWRSFWRAISCENLAGLSCKLVWACWALPFALDTFPISKSAIAHAAPFEQFNSMP